MGKTFAVIGDPIDHSMSPAIHSAAFRQLGMDCSYIAYRIPKDGLEDGLAGLRKIGIAGFNVTVPHKIRIMRYLGRMDEACSIAGAANVVVNNEGILKGYNTDMDGFMEPLRRRGINFAEISVLLLGAGGAARAIAAALAREGTSKMTVANRTVNRGADLAGFASGLGAESDSASLTEAGESADSYDLIINATSAGLGGDSDSPMSMKNVRNGAIAYDIVYAPMHTDFLKRAAGAGASVIFGYEMLLEQAALAFEIWHGIKAPRKAMQKALLGGF